MCYIIITENQFSHLKQNFMSQGIWPSYIQHVEKQFITLPTLFPPENFLQLHKHGGMPGNILEVVGFSISHISCTL